MGTLLLTIFFLAAWPGIIIFFLTLLATPRWNKVLALVMFLIVTLVFSVFYGNTDDDRFGFGALAQYAFWFTVPLGWGAGHLAKRAIARVAVRRRHGIPANVEQEELWVDPDIVFAILLALAIPLLALYYAWFAGASGVIMLVVLGGIILLAAYGLLAIRWRGAAGRVSALKLFCGASFLGWSALSILSAASGMQVEARAREIAGGAPFCIESSSGIVSQFWDMTILNMRIRQRTAFNSDYHGQLVVQRNGELERYHWSYRWSEFHGNGNVFSNDRCLRAFNSSNEIERRKPERATPYAVTKSVGHISGFGRLLDHQTLGWIWFLSLPVLAFFAILLAAKSRIPILLVSVCILEAGLLVAFLATYQGPFRFAILSVPGRMFAAIGLSTAAAMGIRAAVRFFRMRKATP